MLELKWKDHPWSPYLRSPPVKGTQLPQKKRQQLNTRKCQLFDRQLYDGRHQNLCLCYEHQNLYCYEKKKRIRRIERLPQLLWNRRRASATSCLQHFAQPLKAYAFVTVSSDTSASCSNSFTALIRPRVIPGRCKPLSFISSSSFSAVCQSKAFKQSDWINLLYSSTLASTP